MHHCVLRTIYPLLPPINLCEWNPLGLFPLQSDASWLSKRRIFIFVSILLYGAKAIASSC